MNALLLMMMLSASSATETPPPLPPPEPLSPTQGTNPTVGTSPSQVQQSVGPLASPFLGAGFLVAGTVTSLVTTGSYWFGEGTGSGVIRFLSPFGMIVSAIPFFGPIAGFGAEATTSFSMPGGAVRGIFNVVALALQVGGLLFLLNTKNEIRERREARAAAPVQVTGISVDPLDRGATLSLSGNFDFVR